MRRQGGHSQMHMAEVVLKNLKKVYPNTEKKKKKGEPEKKNDLQITDEGVVAVQDFNLHIADKEFIVLVGPSGCGKSTTLRMVAGLEEITSGKLLLDGKVINNRPPVERDIAIVFQDYALYGNLSVYDNVGISMKVQHQKDTAIYDKVQQAAATVDIQQYLNRLPGQLSGGQKQRVAIARACMLHPSVLCFDEPTSALDVESIASVTSIIKDLSKEMAILIITHDEVFAQRVGTRVVKITDINR